MRGSGMPVTSLHAATSSRGARFGDEAGWEIPADFGGALVEARAAHESAVLADLSHWGHFTLRGKDAAPYLHGLISNDVKGLAPGQGCYAAFLNTTGRIESDCYV